MNNIFEHCEDFLKSRGFRKDPVSGIWVNAAGETYDVALNRLIVVPKYYSRGGYRIRRYNSVSGNTTRSLAKIMCRAFTGTAPKKIKYKDGNNKNCSLENIIPEGARII